MTLYKNKIYVLGCNAYSRISKVFVFKAQEPFTLEEYLEFQDITDPYDIVALEKGDCLIISDQECCIWMVMDISNRCIKERRVAKWLDRDGMGRRSFSVCSDGNLLMLNNLAAGGFNLKIYKPAEFEILYTIEAPSESKLKIPIHAVESSNDRHVGEFILKFYKSEFEILYSVDAPSESELNRPIHAVESSMGTFFILHSLETKEWQAANYSNTESEIELNFIKKMKNRRFGIFGDKPAVSEMSRDLRSVYRRFIDRTDDQIIRDPRYLAVDADDRVLVATADTDFVVVLDSNLEYNQRILPITGILASEFGPWNPWRMHFDREKKQLIVAGRGISNAVFIYNLFRR